jgi:hypothetical protein
LLINAEIKIQLLLQGFADPWEKSLNEEKNYPI